MDKLFEYAKSSGYRFDEAVTNILGSRKEIDEWEMHFVIGYLNYGYTNKNGDRLIDVLLHDKGSNLCAEEIDALEMIRQTAWPSLFEIQEVQRDVGLSLRDIATGELLFACEKSLTHHMHKYDHFLMWVMFLDGHYELTGPIVNIPQGYREVVTATLLKQLKHLRKNRPGVDDKILLRDVVPVVHRTLRDAVRDWRPPNMVTSDGDDIIFCQAIFDVSDIDLVRKHLAIHPDMDENDDGFVWSMQKYKNNQEDHRLIFGSIKLHGGRLTLETHSRERLELGKDFIKSYLEGRVRHRMDSVQDLDVAREQSKLRGTKQKAKDEIPAVIKAKVLGDYMQKHMAAWVDEHLPALNGKTPREAVKNKMGRACVISMLKDQENGVLRDIGQGFVDFDGVYAELGILRD
jgi:hypothetical protein